MSEEVRKSSRVLIFGISCLSQFSPPVGTRPPGDLYTVINATIKAAKS